MYLQHQLLNYYFPIGKSYIQLYTSYLKVNKTASRLLESDKVSLKMSNTIILLNYENNLNSIQIYVNNQTSKVNIVT